MRRLRVLHCPTNVGSNPSELAAGERAHGVDSVALAIEGATITSDADGPLFDASLRGLARERARLAALLRVPGNYDIVHFNFGRTFAPGRQDAPAAGLRGAALARAHNLYAESFEWFCLAYLRARGVRIFVTFQGDDARLGSQLAKAAVSPLGEVDDRYYSPASDAVKRRKIARFARFADRIYALNPDLLHGLPPWARFAPYASVDPEAWRPRQRGNVRPVVVHAPSNRAVKGTRFVLDAVDRLKREGVAFDFRLIENVPRREMQNILGSADLVVDQLLLGWYGGLAVEAMALGTPAIAYVRDSDLTFLPADMRREIPLLSATPATVADVVRQAITAPADQKARQSEAARKYVERWHDRDAIAGWMVEEYEAVMSGKRTTPTSVPPSRRLAAAPMAQAGTG